ncbi:class V lanthionine synthetase subunit LxmK [Streptomyces sp. NPDC094437]|uniref:class V lanthionine synthetase subunit LxmK n=1 Tax=Streptomyces sp. NPDC094437 TaxID=3366060 RepID=UPI00380D3813
MAGEKNTHPQGRSSASAVDKPVDATVEQLLARLRLGSLSASDVYSYPGRNDNWSGITDTGDSVFVKQLKGSSGESLKRYRRVVSFERLAARSGRPFPRPEFLGGDEERRLLVFRMLDDVRSGSELAVAEEFTESMSERAGRTLAALHQLPFRDQDFTEADPHPYPPVADLRSLPLELYINATGAFVQAWGLLQRDAALLDELERLRAGEAGIARVPIHGDLRLDQFLLTDTAFYVNDWEEFRLGDPARDVGAYVGEWLHRAVLRIPAQETDDAFSAVLTHEEVVARGAEELARVLPLVSAFHRGYRAGGGPDGDGLVVRATSYAGWHLIDRLIASTRESGRLSAIVRAAAGIGRTALLDPRSFVSTVGLGEGS